MISRSRLHPRSPGAFDIYAVPLLHILGGTSAVVAVWKALTADYADFFVFWDSSRAWLLGVDAYQGLPLRPGAGFNLNAPASILVFVPLACLSIRVALALWTAVTLVSLAVSSRMIAAAIGRPHRWTVVLSALLVSQSAFATLQLGQLAGPLLLLVTCAWLSDRASRSRQTGMLIGALIYAKPFMALFVPYFVLRRAWATVAWIGAAVTTLTLAGLATVGVSGYRSWLTVLSGVTWQSHIANASLMGFLARLLASPQPHIAVTPLLVRPHWVWPVWFFAGVSLVAVMTCACARRRGLDRDWSAVILLSLLLSPLGWNYYAMIAAGPLFATLVDQGTTVKAIASIGFVLMAMPEAVITHTRLLGAGTATLGSSYFWGLLFFLIAVGLSKTPADRSAALSTVSTVRKTPVRFALW